MHFPKRVIIFQTSVFQMQCSTHFMSTNGLKCLKRRLPFEEKHMSVSHKRSSEAKYTLRKKWLVFKLQYLEMNETLLSLLTMGWNRWWEWLSFDRNVCLFLMKDSKEQNTPWKKVIKRQTPAFRNKFNTSLTSNNAFNCFRKVLVFWDKGICIPDESF